ncbi:hypothetical protein GQ53DRAFT_20390 [Thozetella sp. PMI_491]|nr:hypothetical protein GQ53DRAFT_20390 [Thozetella sp. PMI_491]
MRWSLSLARPGCGAALLFAPSAFAQNVHIEAVPLLRCREQGFVANRFGKKAVFSPRPVVSLSAHCAAPQFGQVNTLRFSCCCLCATPQSFSRQEVLRTHEDHEQRRSVPCPRPTAHKTVDRSQERPACDLPRSGAAL